MAIVQEIVQWLAAHLVDIGVMLLVLDRGLEKLFPNATILQKADADLSKVLPPQS